MWKKIVISLWIYFRRVFFFADNWTPTSRFSQAKRNFWTLLNQSGEKATQVSLQSISSFETRLRPIPLHGVPWMGQVPCTLLPVDWDSALRGFAFLSLEQQTFTPPPLSPQAMTLPQAKGMDGGSFVGISWPMAAQWNLSLSPGGQPSGILKKALFYSIAMWSSTLSSIFRRCPQTPFFLPFLHLSNGLFFFSSFHNSLFQLAWGILHKIIQVWIGRTLPLNMWLGLTDTSIFQQHWKD